MIVRMTRKRSNAIALSNMMNGAIRTAWYVERDIFVSLVMMGVVGVGWISGS